MNGYDYGTSHSKMTDFRSKNNRLWTGFGPEVIQMIFKMTFENLFNQRLQLQQRETYFRKNERSKQ